MAEPMAPIPLLRAGPPRRQAVRARVSTIQFASTCSAPDGLYGRLNGTAEPGHAYHDHDHERTMHGLDVRASE